MTEAVKMIPVKTELMVVEGAGHDLGFKGKVQALELPADIFARFAALFG
jgi:hypothetical protein